ncbi:hypothetical protein [Ramlibacter humi]|uniref:Energy transducer TonB n=1 Tax=Ramlibacter humi TaxID=2530451 RepID=A0A4Z0CDP1_9BURK|nr:hypothetical protein [Ramlibacter humi]TFZ08658.1 hypothetical protein EZ216_05755 [Ramlibacter humi]
MRFTRWFTAGWAALLAACGSQGPAPSPAVVSPGAQQATVAAAHPTGPSRSWDDYKMRAARRIHETSPAETFAGPLPDPLRSIPVLQVQLNHDGSVRHINVLRMPRQSPETVEMAMRAIRRAAPFEPVGHLPQPWQFNETFLYNDDLKFQLRTLAEAP